MEYDEIQADAQAASQQLIESLKSIGQAIFHHGRITGQCDVKIREEMKDQLMREDYEVRGLRPRELAERYNINVKEIYNRVNRNGWKKNTP